MFDKTTVRGKIALFALGAALIILSALNVFFSDHSLVAENFIWRVLRLAGTIGLFYAMWNGHLWAKYLAGLLLVATGVIGFFYGFGQLSFSLFILWPFIMSAAYIGGGLALFGYKPIDAFIKKRASKRK